MSQPIHIVMTPTRNEAWVIRAFLESTTRWADYVIICDQFSTDGTREIVNEFASRKQKVDSQKRAEVILDTVCIFSEDWFSPKSWLTLEITPTEQSYSIHHFSASRRANIIEYKKTPVQATSFFIRRCWRWLVKRIKKLLNGGAK